MVEDEVGEFAGADLAVDAESDRHLLVAPLHDVEREFDDLLTREVLVQPRSQIVADLGWERDECLGEVERRMLGVGEPVAVGQAPIDPLLVESLVPGNCQAQRQSSVTVVVAGAPQADEFGGHRIDPVVADRCRGERPERLVQRRVTTRPPRQP